MMKSKFSFIISCLMFFYSCEAQDAKVQDSKSEQRKIVELKYKPKEFILLPRMLTENSALLFYDNLFWTYNDSGGENKIYGYNRQGKIVREVEITTAKNRDWEDMAQDDNFIYIGDFGNNNGTRDNLKVLKISKKEIQRSDSVSADKINFAFADQKSFSFSPKTTPFDCEAVADFNGYLYLFSKNWKTESTTVYKLPKKVGSYNLQPLDSLQVNGLITGADFSPDKTKLALVGYHDFKPILRIFDNVNESKIFGTETISVAMDSLATAQTEGICFVGNDSLLISCESTFAYPAQVFVVNLAEIKKDGKYQDK